MWTARLLDGHCATSDALRFLDRTVLDAAAVFPRDRAPQALPPSTLDRPLIVEDVRRGFAG